MQSSRSDGLLRPQRKQIGLEAVITIVHGAYHCEPGHNLEWNRCKAGIRAYTQQGTFHDARVVKEKVVMSKKKKRKKEDASSIGNAVGKSIDQGIVTVRRYDRSTDDEHVLKTDPKIRSLVEQLVKNYSNEDWTAK